MRRFNLGFSGKSVICLGLALTLQVESYKIGYFKPIGWEMKNLNGEKVDDDVELMISVLDLHPRDCVAS